MTPTAEATDNNEQASSVAAEGSAAIQGAIEARAEAEATPGAIEAAPGAIEAEAAPVAATSGSRTVAGRYRLIEPLGRGGMGRVYQAVDELLDRRVAVKLIYDDAVSERDLRRACAVEARAAARLSHPGIVRILDSGFDDGHCFVVMELAEGESLAEILRRDGPLPIDRALGLAAQVADALATAHREGVVHCDIKPGNLMVDGLERVRLVDFGIARITSSTTSLSSLNLQGSAKYVAPEQVEGTPIDGRTDLYSLGVVLYEMLAGQPPFSGGSLASILAQRLVADPPSVRGVRPDVPPQVEQVVLRAMARDADDRYQTAAELRDALRAARHEGPAATTMPIVEVAASARPRQPRLTWVKRTVGANARPAVGSALRSGRQALAGLLAAIARLVPPPAHSPAYRPGSGWPSLGTGVALATMIGLLMGVAAAQCGMAGVATDAALVSPPVNAPAPAVEEIAPTSIPTGVQAAPTEAPPVPTATLPPPTATAAPPTDTPRPEPTVASAPAQRAAAPPVEASEPDPGDRARSKPEDQHPGPQGATKKPDEKPDDKKPPQAAQPAPAAKPQGGGNSQSGGNGNQKKR